MSLHACGGESLALPGDEAISAIQYKPNDIIITSSTSDTFITIYTAQ